MTRLECTIEDGVADVRLNRPDKLNALDRAMFTAIDDLGETLKRTSGVRAVVISGNGRGFCAGLDLAEFRAMSQDDTDGGTSDTWNPLLVKRGRTTHVGQHICWVWHEIPVPVIAAVHGPALGGGMQLALGADIRIVAPDTVMRLMEVNWGLVPDQTGTVTLSRLVRPDVALEIAVTGRAVNATEAVEIGLATRLSERPRENALRLASDIASNSPDAVRAIKQLFTHARTASEAEQFAEERRLIQSLIGTPNQHEAVAARLEKRLPVFVDSPVDPPQEHGKGAAHADQR